MMEVARSGGGIARQSFPGLKLGAKSALRSVGGVSFCVGANIALDISTPSDCRAVADIMDGRGFTWDEASLAPEEKIPASPRRQLLRNIFAARNERHAVREQRRMEIERELLDKLGLSKPDSDESVAKDLSSTVVNGVETTEGASPHEARNTVDGSFVANDIQPVLRSAERPGSGRRAGLSGTGPPRPPKPKPHRPLNLGEESSPASGASAEDLPQGRRWKSALTSLWPDRQGGASLPCGTASPIFSDQAALDSVQCSAAIDASIDPSSIVSASLPRALSPLQSGSPSHCSTPAQAATDVSPILEDTPCTSRDFSPNLAASPVTAAVVAGASTAAVAAAASAGTAKQVEEVAEHDCRPHDECEQERRLEEAAMLAERTRQLEESAHRLRTNVERLRFENRRARVFGPTTVAAASVSPEGSEKNGGAAQASSPSSSSPPPEMPRARPTVAEAAPAIAELAPASSEAARRMEEMRRKIAELDKVNELERQRLEDEQREVQERRRQQEKFERGLQERAERDLEEHRAREARAELERVEREEEHHRERQGRERRRYQQLQEEEEKSKRLEGRCKEGRSEASQLRWQLFEEELDKQWAAQEAEERRRVETYAKERRRRNEEFDRRFASERLRFASEAEFTAEAARHRQARNAATADEQFYGPRRVRGVSGGSSASKNSETPRPPCPPQRPPPPSGAVDVGLANLSSEECVVLKELQSLRNMARDIQKAKVKELLFRWHPDKNPTCVDKATRVFQFVQRQREAILGL